MKKLTLILFTFAAITSFSQELVYDQTFFREQFYLDGNEISKEELKRSFSDNDLLYNKMSDAIKTENTGLALDIIGSAAILSSFAINDPETSIAVIAAGLVTSIIGILTSSAARDQYREIQDIYNTRHGIGMSYQIGH